MIIGGMKMEVTLEKIELVKDRTGASYKEAKEALEASDGSVVDAIISIEEKIDAERGRKKEIGEKGAAIADTIKDFVRKGNVSKIVVKRDEEVILNLPVNAGIVGVFVAPWGMVAGVVATLGFKCTVEIVKDDGEVIDVSSYTKEKISVAVEKGTEAAETAKEKGTEYYHVAKEKGTEYYQTAVEKGTEYKEKAMERGEEIFYGAKDKANDAISKAKQKVDDIKNHDDDIDLSEDLDEKSNEI